MLRRIVNKLKVTSLIKTLIFNFRVLPLSQAIKLPFRIGRCVVIKQIGRIELHDINAHIEIGTLHLFNACNSMKLIWDNKGLISFCGSVVFQPGTCIHVERNGILKFGGGNYLGINNLICCKEAISIGVNSQTSWNCQITDTDFHFIINIENNTIKKISSPVKIGNNIWIGNHCSICKGVNISDNNIIGQYSVVTKSIQEENRISVGIPSHILNGHFSRIWDLSVENKLQEQFLLAKDKVQTFYL